MKRTDRIRKKSKILERQIYRKKFKQQLLDKSKVFRASTIVVGKYRAINNYLDQRRL
jgi:hypothetical protein